MAIRALGRFAILKIAAQQTVLLPPSQLLQMLQRAALPTLQVSFQGLQRAALPTLQVRFQVLEL